MPRNLIESGPLDVVGAKSRGQTLAENEMNLDKKRNLEGIRGQAAESGYDPKTHKQLLMDNGYFEESLDLDELLANKKTTDLATTTASLGIIEKTANLTQKIGAMGWPTLRSSLIEAGIADHGDLPQEYDEQAQEMAANLSAKASEQLKVLRFRNGNKEKDLLTSGGNIIREGATFAATGGSSSDATALQKNIPTLARVMGIAEKEAAKILTDTKDKSDEGLYASFLAAALRANFGDAEEAAITAMKALNAVRGVRNEKNGGNKPAEKDSGDPLGLDGFLGID